MTGHLRKRSFALAGHRTSVALEGAFWSVLEHLARRESLSLTALIASVDTRRTAGGLPLASALRVFALEAALAGKTAQIQAPAPAHAHAAEN